jgi:hypothetical protein
VEKTSSTFSTIYLYDAAGKAIVETTVPVTGTSFPMDAPVLRTAISSVRSPAASRVHSFRSVRGGNSELLHPRLACTSRAAATRWRISAEVSALAPARSSL